MSKKILICTCGMPGSGKSIIAEVASNMGLPVLIMGDYVRREAKREYGKVTPETTGKVMMELRERMGLDAVAKLLIDDIEKKREKIIIIDGVRCIDELIFFKNKGYKVVTIYVYASRRTRFQRLIERGRLDDINNIDMFIEREEREEEVGVKKLLTLSDFIFINEDIDIDTAKVYASRLIKNIMHKMDDES